MTVYLKDVPRDAAERNSGRAFVAFSLLQHEHKKSVIHFAIQRNTEYEDSVRSKVSHRFPVLRFGTWVTPFRILLYSVWGLDDYESILSTASTLKGVHEVSITYTNLNATCDTGTPTWPLLTGQSSSGINLAHY